MREGYGLNIVIIIVVAVTFQRLNFPFEVFKILKTVILPVSSSAFAPAVVTTEDAIQTKIVISEKLLSKKIETFF